MNEHKNIITIEDEIKEFSDKPVKSSALFKAFEGIFNKVVTATVVVKTKTAVIVDPGNDAFFKTTNAGNCTKTITCSDGGTYSSGSVIILGESNRRLGTVKKGFVLEAAVSNDGLYFYNASDAEITIDSGTQIMDYTIYFVRK